MEKWQFKRLLQKYKNELFRAQEEVYSKGAHALLEAHAHRLQRAEMEVQNQDQLISTDATDPQAIQTIASASQTLEDAVDAQVSPAEASSKVHYPCFSALLSAYPYIGKLKVQVFGVHQSYPIANADVQVSKLIAGETHQLCQFVTNAQGIVEEIVLQVPSAQGSLRAQNEIASAIYDVIVSHPDYHTQYATAEVMQDKTSLLAVQMLANSIEE